MPPIRDVVGYCPMGCGPHLHVMSGGMIKCLDPECPNPGAVTHILSDQETEHVAEITDDGWTLKHPLRERLGGDLFACEMGRKMTAVQESERSMAAGRWRLTLTEQGSLVFKRADPPG